MSYPNTSQCQCGAKMLWLKTRIGARIPVNFEERFKDDKDFDRAKHIAHFATCPMAKKFRRSR